VALRAACERPADVARAWRAGGRPVVGMLGWSAPRELVVAAGMLPVRLSPGRLGGVSPDGGEADSITAGLSRELTPDTARVATALLSGALDWVDFLLIGRDREAHTKLYYMLRELRRSGAAPSLPPVAFFDLLRLPSRTSARYNRRRAAELTVTIAGWAGRPVTPAGLADAAEAARATAHLLRGMQALRARPRPAITGTDALAAAIAARTLPARRLHPLLGAALADAPDRPAAASGSRVFLAGSGLDDLAAYQGLEKLGLAIVGEDHEWGDDGSEAPVITPDPLDGIVDRYHFAHGGAARAGLRDRAARTAARIRASGADGVLYVLGPHDEAAGWELAQVRDLVGDMPLNAVRLRERPAPGGADPELGEAGQRLLHELNGARSEAGAGLGVRAARRG
jgi:hypothetical protein